MEIHGTQIIPTLGEKKKKRELTFPNFKIYHEAMVITMVWYWHIDQQNRIRSPEIDTYR